MTLLEDDLLEEFLDACDIDYNEYALPDDEAELFALFPDGEDDDLKAQYEELFSMDQPLGAPATTWVDRIRSYGVKVIEVSGWQTRGSRTFHPKGIVAHHTASRTGSDAPSLSICTHGRSDLPGPLCQILLSRSGVAYIIASGRANHAGSGGYAGLSGNSSVWGIEAENNGVGEPWNNAQLEAYYRICVALLEEMRVETKWVCGHKEWAPRRKIDPAGIDMNVFRGKIQEVRSGAGGVIPYEPNEHYTPEEGNLKIWMFGDRTWTWQAHLVKYAGAGIRADKYFGPTTHTATVNFQKFFDLTVDGIVGPKTLETMAYVKALNEQESVKPPPAVTSLKRGSTGEAVKEIQRLLGVTADGLFGSKTEQAVKRFQARIGLSQTGAWDAATRAFVAGLPNYGAQPTIKLGSRGNAVSLWQSSLNKYVGQRIVVDGIFGAGTAKATRNFQAFFGMRADAIVGPKTWGMMDFIIKRT